MKKIPLFPSLLLAACFASVSYADIKEIPAEEMTESYIRDTTVLVPKAQDSQPSNVQVKVDPNPAPTTLDSLPKDDGSQASKPAIGSSYAPEQRELQLQQSQQRTASQQPIFDPQQQSRDDNLRSVLRKHNIDFASIGVPETGPIDYSKLQYPSMGKVDAQGNSVNATANQIIISVPNSGYSFKEQQTPKGEYQIRVENGNLQLIINRPKP